MVEILAIGVIAFVILLFVAWVLRRYKRCPSDKILVVYGKVGGKAKGGMSARCYHGGAAFILPVFQDYAFLDLTPLPIDIKLEGALSQQNIRVNTPSTFTVGISTEPGVMENAAERLLGLDLQRIAELARDIIFGQMRVVLATMPIEEINADRDKLIENITNGVEGELKKIGLRLINVNIQDITDESGYIDALGKEAAARAINEAKIKVAEQERDGAIGAARAEKDQRIEVASAQATAVEGENLAKIKVAQSDAERRGQEAEAERSASAAEKVKAAQALEEAYKAEELSERQRARREEATQRANVVVPAQVKKEEIETLAEAEAEKERRTKRGEADGLRALMEAEAAGLNAILVQKAAGFDRIVAAARGVPELASLLLVTEQLPKLVEEQVKAISNLKIDNITVWDGGRSGDGKTATADFVSGLVGSLPPLHELTKNVGVRLPEFMGQLETPPALPGDDDDDPTSGGSGSSSGSGGAAGGGSTAAGGESSGGGARGGTGAGSSGASASSQSAGSEAHGAAAVSSEPEAPKKADSRSEALLESTESEVEEARAEAEAAAEAEAPVAEHAPAEHATLFGWLADHADRLADVKAQSGEGVDTGKLEEAMQTALSWARRAGDPKSSWYYVQDGRWIGPRNWYRVLREAENNPWLPVNLDKAKTWLPFGAIEKATKELQ